VCTDENSIWQAAAQRNVQKSTCRVRTLPRVTPTSLFTLTAIIAFSVADKHVIKPLRESKHKGVTKEVVEDIS